MKKFGMHVAILLLICAGLSACFQTYGQGDKRVLTAPEIAEKALASTVHLFVIRGSNPYSASANFIGSGFFITPRSIVTNYHVIENFMPVLVDHMEEKQLQYRVIAIPTQVIADAKGNFDNKGVSNNVRNGNPSIIEVNHNPIFDKRFGDLAILKTITTEKQPIAIGNSDTVKIGEAVYIAGTAIYRDVSKEAEANMFPCFTSGIISNIQIYGNGYGSETQTFVLTARSTRGSSGSPLLNNKGEVVGIIVGHAFTPSAVGKIEDGEIIPKRAKGSMQVEYWVDAPQNFTLAIPVKYLEKLLAEN